MWYLVQKHAFMGEVFYQRAFSGAKPWHHHYRDPAWGVGLMATDAGSPELLRTVLRAVPYFDLPLLDSPSVQVHARFGWGIGWVTDPYDLRENHRQNAIGSRLNAAALIALEARKRFGPHMLGAGIALDHLSNASLQVPNLGINMVTFSFSYRYVLDDRSRPPLRTLPHERGTTIGNERRYEEFLAGWARQQVDGFEGDDHTVLSFTAGAIWRTGIKSGFGAGVDLFNKGSLRRLAPELADEDRLALIQAGVHASYRLYFGDLVFVVDQGFYLRTPFDEKTLLYQRLGLRQVFLRNFFANITLKTHFGSADHFELGIGYAIR